jgi:hypothetical protein
MIRLTAAVATLVALAPSAAIAAGVHPDPQLGGQPQMRIIDDHHATLEFASDRLPRIASGRVDATTFAAAARVSGLEPIANHGNDIRYSARVTFKRRLQDHQKFSVTLRLGDAKPVQRFVKLYDPGEHGG